MVVNYCFCKLNKALKYFFTLFLIILIPVYWYNYGIQNFLWFSDIGLFLTVITVFTGNNLPISMAAVGLIILESIWTLDFFLDLCTKYNLIDLADYMFDIRLPLSLRLLSLFHLMLPIIWIYYLYKKGYDTRAFKYFTVLFWAVILITYFFTPIADNINWVFLPEKHNLKFISPSLWALLLFIVPPFLLFLPTHLIYKKIYKNI